jgi:leucyl-tRNA synthetase
MEEIGRVAHSWLSRVWRIVGDVSDDAPSDALTVALNRTIKGVTEDMGSMGFNTAIAKLMELVNDFSKLEGAVPRVAAETFLKLLAPIAPFIAEEMWAVMGHDTSIHGEAWPAWDDKVVSSQRVTMVVQVGGKVRDRIEVEPNITEEAMKELAFASQKAQAFLNGKPKKVIVVPPKLVNLVP